jgi:ribosomal protein L11 methyltransferase
MNEYYYELAVTPVGKYYTILFDFITSTYFEAIEEKDGSIILRDTDSLEDIKWAIENFSNELLKVTNEKNILEINSSKKKNIDWIDLYKKSIQPLKIGDFYIRPSWEEKQEDLIDIVIDPALAFGSGHHETTSSVIEALQEYTKEYDQVLDVGCGSGILALVADKLNARVTVCDTDPDAVESTKNNFKLNDSKYENAWVGSANKATKKYDIVLANIVADILLIIKADLENALKDRGILILSGILDTNLKKVLSSYSDFEIIKIIEKNEWRTVVLKRK